MITWRIINPLTVRKYFRGLKAIAIFESDVSVWYADCTTVETFVNLQIFKATIDFTTNERKLLPYY